MPERFDPEEITLSRAAASFIAASSTESGEHIRPLHRYLSVRLVIEGGFLPEQLFPSPPLKSEYRDGTWHLSFNPTAESRKEQIVLGAFKSKRIDIVVAKEGIGPLLAISVKGTSKAFRNLVYRFVKAYTLKVMCKIEVFPSVYNRRIIDFFNTEKNSIFEFLLGGHANMFQEGSGHFTKKCFNQI